MDKVSNSKSVEECISSQEQYAPGRPSAWLHWQSVLLQDVWVTHCRDLGLITNEIGYTSSRLADDLMARFFVGLGNVYRETDIDWDTLRPIYIRIIEDLLEHACKVKWLLSESTGDIGWATVVEKICATSKTKVSIDHNDQVAFHDVFVPYVDEEQKIIEGETRIRHVIYLKQSQSSLEELIGHFQLRMTGNFLQTQ